MLTTDLRSKLDSTLSFFKAELAKIRTGQASVALVEDIEVAAYPGSSPLTIKELGNLSVPEVDLILIEPWDASVVGAIEKALQSANFNPITTKELIRVPLPSLNEERRLELVRQVKSKAEESRKSIRSIRKDAMKAVDRLKEAKELGEDVFFKRRQEIEDLVREVHDEIDALSQSKEKSLKL